jgi:hypothetical protein
MTCPFWLQGGKIVFPLPRFRFPFTALLAALTALSVCSCGRQSAGVHPVHGLVFVAGQPAAGAIVVFHALHNSSIDAPRPSGRVAADGSFVLSTFAPGDGAPAGEYGVAVAWYGDAPPDPVTGQRAVKLAPGYGNRAVTPLRAVVRDRATDLPAFNLPN